MSEGRIGKVLLRFFAAVMVLVGAAIAGLAGLCTYAISTATAANSGGGAGFWIIGAVPILLGVAIIVAGVVVWRSTLTPGPGR
jgi:hypothetical protein